eukprot:m.48805 g.48805  ORF g.48805 m.48805 type:complete len:561 (-) comp10854_c0_seq4:20-1702(-)
MHTYTFFFLSLFSSLLWCLYCNSCETPNRIRTPPKKGDCCCYCHKRDSYCCCYCSVSAFAFCATKGSSKEKDRVEYTRRTWNGLFTPPQLARGDQAIALVRSREPQQVTSYSYQQQYPQQYQQQRQQPYQASYSQHQAPAYSGGREYNSSTTSAYSQQPPPRQQPPPQHEQYREQYPTQNTYYDNSQSRYGDERRGAAYSQTNTTRLPPTSQQHGQFHHQHHHHHQQQQQRPNQQPYAFTEPYQQQPQNAYSSFNQPPLHQNQQQQQQYSPSQQLQVIEEDLQYGTFDPYRRRELEDKAMALRKQLGIGTSMSNDPRARPPPLQMHVPATPPPQRAKESSPATPNSLLKWIEEEGLLLSPTKPFRSVLGETEPVPLTQEGIKGDVNMLFVSLLYDDVHTKKCPQCGTRFPKEKQNDFDLHLDWHFRRNQETQTAVNVARGWFVEKSDWEKNTNRIIEEVDADEEGVQSSTKGLGSGTTTSASTHPSVNNAHKPKILSSRVKASGSSKNCTLCGEEFETDYDDDEEEWILRDVVLVDGIRKVFHRECYDTATEDNRLSCKS